MIKILVWGGLGLLAACAGATGPAPAPAAATAGPSGLEEVRIEALGME